MILDRNKPGPQARQELAESMDEQLSALYEEQVRLWGRVARIAGPFKEAKLYRDLGFKSWEEYCLDRFGSRDTSINNYLKPWLLLKQAGQDPEKFLELSLSRANQMAIVALAKGKNWSEEE